MIILFSGAWIWPEDSITFADTVKIGGNYLKLFTFVLIALQAARGLQALSREPSVNRLLWPIGMCVILTTLIVGGSPFYMGQALVTFSGITLGTHACLRDLGARQVWRVFVITACIILGISIFLATIYPNLGQHTGLSFGDWRGSFGNRNNLAGFSIVSLIAAGLALAHKVAVVPYVVLALASVCAFMSGSALGTGLTIIILVASAVVTAARELTSFRIHVLISAAIVGAFCLAVMANDWLPFALDMFGKDASFTGRTAIWEGVLTAYSKSPVFGLGAGVFAADAELLDELRADTFFALRSAHSGYLQSLLEGGVFGLALFISIHMIAALNAIRTGVFYVQFFGLIGVASLLVYAYFESASSYYAGLGTLLAMSIAYSSRCKPAL